MLGALIGILATILVGKASSVQKVQVNPYSWHKLNLILTQIEENYVDTIDVKAISDAAVEGALKKLDPHSVYLPPEDLEESETDLSGNFEGIGIQFNVPNDTAVVLSVISGGPSEKAGLLQGDRIVRVDTVDIAGVNMNQNDMVKKMKGPQGSKVTITIQRDGAEIPFTITRDKIPVNSVDAAFLVDESTGYMRITKFSRTTYKEFHSATSDMLKAGMQRLIVDLRDNSGGYMDQALLMCNEFLTKGDMILYIEGRMRSRQEYKADGRGALQEIPLAVLINENSASSSEIFAGAMQDNDRAVIIGRRSFGKGLVQEPIYFTDGSGIRLTTARYYIPSGRCIQKPYSDDYAYDIVDRYVRGEMTSADSISIDKSIEYQTLSGRKVYGGGGVVPDIFVPVDTSKVTDFYYQCNKKTLQMRFASAVFDRYKSTLSKISDFAQLDEFICGLSIKDDFIAYAAKQGIECKAGQWEASEEYLLPQLKGLIGRYSKLGEEAFYKYYFAIDNVVLKALDANFIVER